MQKRTSPENATPAANLEIFFARLAPPLYTERRRVKLLFSDISRLTFVEIKFECPYLNQNLTSIYLYYIIWNKEEFIHV